MFKIKKYWNDVYLATFDTQYNMNRTMIRFQEYYESPQFKDKVFFLKEFKEWYIKNSTNGKKTGKFTYYKDWNGCNVPVKTILDFISKCNKLTKPETELFIELANEVPKDAYLIATHTNYKNRNQALIHELAHALFRNKRYHRKVDTMMRGHNDCAKTWMYVYKLGYHDSVFLDELQAYMISGYPGSEPTKLQERMRKYFETKVDMKKLKLKWE